MVVDVNIDNLVKLFGTVIANDGTIIDTSTYLASMYHVGVQYIIPSNKLNFQIAYTGGLSKAYVTIQYTKTE